MLNSKIGVTIEIPSNIPQREVWDTEEQLKLIENVETDLQEAKDVTATMLLVLNIATTTVGTIASTAGGAKAVYDVAKILYDFLHRSKEKPVDNEMKRKIVIVKKGKRTELYNLSLEEIRQVLKDL